MKVAIIPARGGSKRIPKKNIREFCGKPMIAYSIEAAIQSAVFDRILVSTDDGEIAELAERHGAEAPFRRPAELATDHATTVPVIRHAIEWCNANWAPVERACCIYATAPFVQPHAIKTALELLNRENVRGYVFTATSFPFPVQRAFRVKHDGHVQMFHPENYNTRSQDLEPAFHDAGQFYWGTAEAFLADKPFFSEESMVQLLPRHLVQDIDTAEDWTRAELMYQVLSSCGQL
jgi:pseudaminic acid cytidylyltransferase